MASSARDWIEKIRGLETDRPVRILNVCGGHERTLAAAGIRSLMPPNIRLIAGPGCPVCVCPEEDLYQLIRWAVAGEAIVVAFGDMLRVPVNAPKSEARSLEEAKAAGADVVAAASPRDAVEVARRNPDRPVIFHAVGFETTLAPISAAIVEGLPENLFLLMSGRLTWPIVAQLLASDDVNLEGLVAPGHVATIMGATEWAFVPQEHGVPAAVAGFTAESLLEAIYTVASRAIDGAADLSNCYSLAVRDDGNALARQMMQECFEVTDANWRGIGVIPNSGFELKEKYAAHDARRRFPVLETDRKRAGQMPAGCDCARVVMGRIAPNECVLYGAACTPRSPVGPCMVSDEGACRIWWSSGIRERAPGADAEASPGP
ncbi:hydrogenase formation protein HypD [Methylocystis echinoides]|uniref:Hydrogenase maturation factor n=1 Tax=Methylocystis echinoides TaxID=29468 RepID=A0A9W6GSR6_9HYPH|nr:hydrogenase formation protein HypD [Methylocystis echinoides]GLI92413.1 hydrogenase formation protein HypD [Methylocystis echinoides]